MRTALNNLPKNTVCTRMDSPVGKLILIASDQGLHALLWEKDLSDEKYKSILANIPEAKDHQILTLATEQLQEYFSGHRNTFDLPLVVEGTPFQKLAWQQLRKIPYGKTISYGEQAHRLGDKRKARAVGLANSQNPISIIVPCHRVIASTGALHGFGGGLEAKKILLDLEKSFVN